MHGTNVEPVLGVALIVVCTSTGRILMLRELKSKPEINKFAGMLGIPCETQLPEEVTRGACWSISLRRLVREEIDPERAGTIALRRITTKRLVLPHVFLHVGLAEVAEEFTAAPLHADEVEHGGWYSIEAITALPEDAQRVEVARIIEQYEHHCRAPFRGAPS